MTNESVMWAGQIFRIGMLVRYKHPVGSHPKDPARNPIGMVIGYVDDNKVWLRVLYGEEEDIWHYLWCEPLMH